MIPGTHAVVTERTGFMARLPPAGAILQATAPLGQANQMFPKARYHSTTSDEQTGSNGPRKESRFNFSLRLVGWNVRITGSNPVGKSSGSKRTGVIEAPCGYLLFPHTAGEDDDWFNHAKLRSLTVGTVDFLCD